MRFVHVFRDAALAEEVAARRDDGLDDDGHADRALEQALDVRPNVELARGARGRETAERLLEQAAAFLRRDHCGRERDALEDLESGGHDGLRRGPTLLTSYLRTRGTQAQGLHS